MKQPWYSRKGVVISLHIAAWIFLFSLPFILRPAYDSSHQRPPNPDQKAFDILYFCNATIWCALFYLNANVLIPKLMYKKKYWQYAGSLLVVFFILIYFGRIYFYFFIPHSEWRWSNSFLFGIFTFLFFVACSTAYQMIRFKIKDDQIVKERENESLKTELSLLRSQVSPHFMFNVLNNMVALARKRSDLLEPSLIKLSSLMRYMIYEADEKTVPLEKEIEYLQSYIDLQQQRFGKNVKVNVSLNGCHAHEQIEPMLLIPFVENAFKHGTGMIDDAQIDIELRTKNQVLDFQVRNKYNGVTEEVKDKTSGIGLTNVRRRLNLLYNGHHSLLISRKDGWFLVSLQIILH